MCMPVEGGVVDGCYRMPCTLTPDNALYIYFRAAVSSCAPATHYISISAGARVRSTAWPQRTCVYNRPRRVTSATCAQSRAQTAA
eukprot:7490177-Heterocapsa_arctica.AAC.1